VIRIGAGGEEPSVELPPDRSWKRELAVYLEVDRGRSLAQIASVVPPYLGVWILAAIVEPGAWLAVGLGLVATVFLVRMYSFFHDLTHNSMFESRRENSRWGYLLGFLLFTPYRWWQRQHSLHHAGTGNLDKRGPGEIYTMTLAEYENASTARRLAYRAYRNPLLMLFVGPSLVFLFERRFPQRGMTRRIFFSVVATNLALVAWGGRLERASRRRDLPAHPGHDPRGRRGDRRLDALHPASVRGDLLRDG
jgi:acyl-lipid omega-6 desaturase (Delta-12 desaturase)